MDENDIQILTDLMKKAANVQWYDIAIHLKDVRNKLTSRLKNHWTNEIIKHLEK